MTISMIGWCWQRRRRKCRKKKATKTITKKFEMILFQLLIINNFINLFETF